MRVASTSLAKIGLNAIWPGGDRRTALRYRNFEGHQRAGAKSVLEQERTCGNSQRTSPVVPRWPQGSTPGYVIRKLFRADTSAGGARRAGTKPFLWESNARAGQARARPWLQPLREGSGMAATSGAFVGGETAGALFVLWKTAMGARINGAWATPRRSPGSRSVAPMMGRTCRHEAAKLSSARRRSDCGNISTR